MYADNVPVPTSKDQWDYVQSMSNNLRSTFSALSTTVFSPACIAHEVLLGRDWTIVEVDGVTLPDALECWTSSLPTVVPEHLTTSEEVVFSSVSSNLGLMIRSQMKSDSSAINSGFILSNHYSNINSKSPSMLADAPRTTDDLKLARNLVRKIVTPTEEAEQIARNSFTISKKRKIKGNRRIVDNRTDRRRLSKYGDRYFVNRNRNGAANENSAYKNKVIDREERRRKRKRLQRQLQKCMNGDDDACEKLRKHHGKEMFEDDPLNGGAGKGKLKQNSDLVRSLDRRSSRKGSNKDKTSTDRRKRKSARQRNLEKRRAKRLRKQKRKQQRRERKRRQREKLKKQRERQKLRRRRKQNNIKDEIVHRNISHDVTVNVPASSLKDEKHHLKVRSIQQEQSFLSSPNKSSPKSSSQRQCRTKLIDNCSWPHCNRSCPKLKNPKTGKYLHP